MVRSHFTDDDIEADGARTLESPSGALSSTAHPPQLSRGLCFMGHYSQEPRSTQTSPLCPLQGFSTAVPIIFQPPRFLSSVEREKQHNFSPGGTNSSFLRTSEGRDKSCLAESQLTWTLGAGWGAVGSARRCEAEWRLQSIETSVPYGLHSLWSEVRIPSGSCTHAPLFSVPISSFSSPIL